MYRRLGIVLGAMAVACGGTAHSGSGSNGPLNSSAQVTLQIATSGSGVVRGAGSDCRGSCAMTFARGAQVQLAPVADAGATFSGWSGACSGSGACALTLDADTSVAAAFTQSSNPAGTHVVSVIVEGQGRVVSDPAGIDCSSGGCLAAFADGAHVALTATAATGFTFAGFGGGCHGPACVLTISADTQVFAHFDATQPGTVTVSVTVEGPGHVAGSGINCGNGASTCQVSVASGTAISLMATAADGARFAGWSGACTGSAGCSLNATAPVAIKASFLQNLTTLVAADGSAMPPLAINSTTVFYGRHLADGDSVWSVPKAGGTATRIGAGSPAVMLADDAFVYWTNGSSIDSAPVGGGAVSQLAGPTRVGDLKLDTDGSLFWAELPTTTSTGAIHRMQNRADAVVVANAEPIFGLALDDTYVYYTVSGSGTLSGVDRTPKNGRGKVEFVASGTDSPFVLLRSDAANLYWRTASGLVRATAKTSDTPHLVSTANGPSSSMTAMAFDVNASVVYWNWMDNTSAPQGLFQANADGTGETQLDTGMVTGVRVDDTAIFYWKNGALIRRLK